MQGATKPPVEPELTSSNFGFVENAEIINSRAAMVSPAQRPPGKPCAVHCGRTRLQKAAVPQQKASHTVSRALRFLRVCFKRQGPL